MSAATDEQHGAGREPARGRHGDQGNHGSHPGHPARPASSAFGTTAARSR
ncbi:hypothetical protein [Streptomyces sp. NPDC059452]